MKRHCKVISSSNTDADLYVIRFLVEIDPGHDVLYPQVAEDFIEVYATSPQEAREYALRQWGNQPYERIDIVDINPGDDYNELPPFNSSSICGSIQDNHDWPDLDYWNDPNSDLDRYLYEPEMYALDDLGMDIAIDDEEDEVYVRPEEYSDCLRASEGALYSWRFDSWNARRRRLARDCSSKEEYQDRFYQWIHRNTI